MKREELLRTLRNRLEVEFEPQPRQVGRVYVPSPELAEGVADHFIWILEEEEDVMFAFSKGAMTRREGGWDGELVWCLVTDRALLFVTIDEATRSRSLRIATRRVRRQDIREIACVRFQSGGRRRRVTVSVAIAGGAPIELDSEQDVEGGWGDHTLTLLRFVQVLTSG